jgi:hypothetical protein
MASIHSRAKSSTLAQAAYASRDVVAHTITICNHETVALELRLNE